MKIHKTFQRVELDNLPSDQLDRMLHEELNKETKDAELILALSHILEEREANIPKPDAGEAWQTFRDRYNTEIEEAPSQPKKKPWRWIGVTAAAVAVFFVVSFGIPRAAGHDNIFQLIASWTDDFFYLSDPDDTLPQNKYVFKTDHHGLQQVYDAVVELGITDPVVPTWLPEGYELVDLGSMPIAGGKKLCAIFERGDTSFVFHFRISQSPKNTNSPKDELGVAVVEIGGVSVYVYSNDENISAIWNIGNAECFLTATEDKKTVISIIESIYYGE